MKKITSLTIGALMAVGFVAIAGQAHAADSTISPQADSLPADQVMGSENAKIAQQSLNVLGMVLSNLNESIDTNNSPADIAAINTELTAIQGELLSLHSTIALLEAQTSALAEKSVPNEPPVAIAQPRTSIETPGIRAATPPIVANTQNNTAASASLAGGLGKFTWPTLIVAAIVIGIFLLRKRNPEESESMTENQKNEEDPETFSYLPTITDY